MALVAYAVHRRVLDVHTATGSLVLDVHDAPRREVTALVVSEHSDAIRAEHATVAASDELTPRAHAQRPPSDRVGVGERAILQKALHTTHRQAGRVDRHVRIRAHRADELDAAERALTAADDRDVRALLDRRARDLHAPAVTIQQARSGVEVVGDRAGDAGAGEH